MSRKRASAKNSLELKNFQAWIEVDGEKLDCHAIDIPNKRIREASCWVASEENKTFSVKLHTAQLTKCHCRVTLSLDGTKITSRTIRKTDSYTASFSRLDTNNSFRRFKFAPLNVTDEEEYRDTIALRPAARQIGEITLRVYRVILKTIKLKNSESSSSRAEDRVEEDKKKESVPQLQKVHESSVKATLVPHQVCFGDPIPKKTNSLPSGGVLKSASEKEYYTKTSYTKKECLATFTFRYRPLDVLVDGGIVPRRMLNPDAESSQDEDEDMDTDDREFRGSPPPTLSNATALRRASTRVASAAPDGNGNRVNYADYDSIEDGDDADIYVRTDEERAMREAQAQLRAQAEVEPDAKLTVQPDGQAPTAATVIPVRGGGSGAGAETVGNGAPPLIPGQLSLEGNPSDTAAPMQTVHALRTPPPGTDIQRQPLPIIRQESEEPNLNLNARTAEADGQPKDIKPSEAIVKQETREMKLEEIEKKVSPLSEDDEEDEDEREARLTLEAIRERKRKKKELQRAEAAKRVKTEPDTRFYFKPGEVVDLVSS